MFLNSPVKVFSAISNSSLTSVGNELYENGIRIATQTDIDTLQSEIDNIVPGNPNSLVTDTPLQTPQAGSIIFSDGVDPFGTNTDSSFTYTNISKPILTVGAGRIVSDNNNMELESTDYILTKKDFYLQGTEDVQRYLTVGCLNQTDNVKTFVDINTADYICDNQLTTKTQWKGASEYDFDNDVKIGDISTTKKLYLNDVEITPSSGVGVSAGMLRALNLNLLVPEVAQTYDVVWSNLTAQQQLEWKGLDPTTSDPVQSATGNYWSFVKSAPSGNKINWTLPIDLGNITFEDLQSVWAIVRFNNSTTINAEGQLWFQIQTNPPTAPNFYRTRWNYSNSATPINQFQYFYKIHALDTITTTITGNLGKGQEVGQTKFKGNPCDVEPNLWSIGFNKLVGSPTGDTTTPGYTRGAILSVALNTASNIHTYNFDVVAIGVNNIRYNLFYA